MRVRSFSDVLESIWYCIFHKGTKESQKKRFAARASEWYAMYFTTYSLSFPFFILKLNGEPNVIIKQMGFSALGR